MNKEELKNEIEKIPKFVLRDVAVNKVFEKDVFDWNKNDNWKAVTEENNFKPFEFVSKRYKLIQFKDVFIPLIQNIPELKGDLVYYNGMAFMDIFPIEERLKVNGGEDRIGLVACNSVNKTSSVIVKFCVEYNKQKITIPKGIAGFKRVHSGKAIEMTQNFLEIVDKVRNVWKTILEEFSKIVVDENYVKNILNDLKITDNYIHKKVLKYVITKDKPTLWDLFIYIIDVVNVRSFKSDLHRRKKLDLISEKIFKYAIMSKLINA